MELTIENIKEFERDNCLTQDEIDLFSRLVSELQKGDLKDGNKNN